MAPTLPVAALGSLDLSPWYVVVAPPSEAGRAVLVGRPGPRGTASRDDVVALRRPISGLPPPPDPDFAATFVSDVDIVFRVVCFFDEELCVVDD